MSGALDYKKEIINPKELPEDKLIELIDFAQFLKARKERFTFMQVRDSAEYVRKIRTNEAKRTKSGKRFIDELIEWQKSKLKNTRPLLRNIVPGRN